LFAAGVIVICIGIIQCIIHFIPGTAAAFHDDALM
jgi:hypothetical protein